ncbi:MAG: hypothetical protein JWP74_1782 [Marmoricola sp.]|nr:hypothetical protein [Marmoricola sp.]
MNELSDKSKRVLEFERQRWKYAGAKEAAIRETFGCSTTKYYQRLGAILEDPAAMAYDAQFVKRLVRLRDARRRVRTAG